MSDVTELRCWPSGVDAIDWSHDGIMAMASDEIVELLFPNTGPYDPEQEDTSWQHVPLQTSWFTKDELPEKESAPVPTYSIGEEISASLPVRIAWSPSGLAKYRRCALAALTSNLILSLWSADGKPQEESSWERRLVVNDALAEYFAGDAAHEESVLVSETMEKTRLRTRIRAFAWAPALPDQHECSIVGTQLCWGQQLLATSNDDNQIVLLLIESPTSSSGSQKVWNAEVLNHFSTTPDPGSIPSKPHTLDEIMQQQRHISCLGWSPWTVQGDKYHSVLTYATNEDVRACIVTHNHNAVSLGDEVIYGNINLRFKGPMKWSPKVVDGNKLTLALFTHTGITCLTISATNATILNQTFHDLDGRWDETSGVVWDYTVKAQPRLHFSSLSSTMAYPTATLKLSEGSLSADASPYWREHVRDTQTLFSAQNELKGNARSRVWGLVASPLGDFIAASYTLHPSDMIEYGPPSDRRSTLAVNGVRSYSQMPLAFPTGNVSAEGILFTLRKWLDNTVEDPHNVSAFAEDVLNKLMEKYGGGIQAQHDLEHNAANDMCGITRSFKREAFLNSYTLKDRYSILISQVCSPSDAKELERILVAYRLSNVVVHLPANLCEATPFSAEILSAHQQVMTIIRYLLNDEDNVDADDTPTAPVVGTVGSDTCDMCNAMIPFVDLKSASCTNGHQFPRCGLSFIAIQAPRITKYCGICKTPYLSDDFVFAQETGGKAPSRHVESTLEVDTLRGSEAGLGRNGSGNGSDEERGLPVSLARVLFLACDACIYCGGKFVG